MTDIISRADAIEAVRKKLQDWGGYAFEDYRRGLYEAQDIIEALPSAEAEKSVGRYENAMQKLRDMPMYLNGVKEKQITKISADAEQWWNNHEVACILAELFGDACACNYNGIDEWLPLVCDLKDSCPNTVGVACWEQFLKHYGERRKP